MRFHYSTLHKSFEKGFGGKLFQKFSPKKIRKNICVAAQAAVGKLKRCLTLFLPLIQGSLAPYCGKTKPKKPYIFNVSIYVSLNSSERTRSHLPHPARSPSGRAVLLACAAQLLTPLSLRSRFRCAKTRR